MEDLKDDNTGSIGYKVNYLTKVDYNEYGVERKIDVYLSLHTKKHLIYEPICIVKRERNSAGVWELVPDIQDNSDGVPVLYLHVIVDDPKNMKMLIKEALHGQKLDFEIFDSNIAMVKITKINLNFEGLPPYVTVESTNFSYDDRQGEFQIGFIIEGKENRSKFMKYLSNYQMKASAKFVVSQEEGRTTKDITEIISCKNLGETAIITELFGTGDVFYVLRKDLKDLINSAAKQITAQRYSEYDAEGKGNIIINEDIINSLIQKSDVVDVNNMSGPLKEKIIKHSYHSKDVQANIVKKTISHKEDQFKQSNSTSDNAEASFGIKDIFTGGGKCGSSNTTTEETKHVRDKQFEGEVSIAKDVNILEISKAQISSSAALLHYEVKGKPHNIINTKCFLPLIQSSLPPLGFSAKSEIEKTREEFEKVQAKMINRITNLEKCLDSLENQFKFHRHSTFYFDNRHGWRKTVWTEFHESNKDMRDPNYTEDQCHTSKYEI